MNRFAHTVLLASTVLATAALTQGCATSIKASAANNPAPSEAFKSFGRVEVKPVVFKEGVQGNPNALAKISQNLQHDLKGSLEEWNKGSGNGRTLIIEPVVEEMSFKSGATRVFLGPLAGSSGVLMRMNIRDDKGRVIATPEFFQRANAMAAGWALGVHDNLMLTRVATLASSYVKANYAAPVGGPTGGADPVLNP
jgi:hypothetical protein